MLDKESPIIPKVLNYFIQNLTNEGMILKVNFSDPLYVSSSILKDVINLEFLNIKIFQAKLGGYR
jgi:hypothetical protein